MVEFSGYYTVASNENIQYVLDFSSSFCPENSVHNASIIIIVITLNPTNDFLFTICTFRKVLLQYQTLELGNKN